MTCHVFRRKMSGTNSPYVYNMYLRTFYMHVHTPRPAHKQTNSKQRYDSYGTHRLETCWTVNFFWQISYISNMDLGTAAASSLCLPLVPNLYTPIHVMTTPQTVTVTVYLMQYTWHTKDHLGSIIITTVEPVRTSGLTETELVYS